MPLYIYEYICTYTYVSWRHDATIYIYIFIYQVIGLGWLDDSMQLTGPTEEDKHYIADTCGVNTSTKCVKEMESQVAAYLLRATHC
eukprot:COSAG06_NODE_29098_length_562_cov_1.954644_1_plen_86_part_00